MATSSPLTTRIRRPSCLHTRKNSRYGVIGAMLERQALVQNVSSNGWVRLYIIDFKVRNIPALVVQNSSSEKPKANFVVAVRLPFDIRVFKSTVIQQQNLLST